MAGSYPSQLGPGLFVPTTNVWDVSQLYNIEVTSPEFKELLVRLYQNINNISLALNLKDTGYYVQTEFVNGQVFFPNPALSSTTQQAPTFRQVFRLVIDFGALPNTSVKSVAHGLTITNSFAFTRIYATASDTTGHNYIPIPYSSSVDTDEIELYVDNLFVNIATAADRTNFDVCYVVLEYIKQ